MKYLETVKFLFSQLPMYQRVGQAAYKANLKNTILLDQHLGNPHKKFKTIHIAGTNGKGSVSHMISSVLQESGLKVGLYTSPHLTDFRERIKVNGKKIPKIEVVNFIKKNTEIVKKICPSFFELTVAMAFNYFAKKRVDIAIIETGLGGRLDSTNIISPILSVITNISFDHIQFLGDTLEKIATEKAGIIKSNIPVIIGETQEETKNIFINIAKKRESNIIFSDKQYKINYSLISLDNKQVFNIKENNNIKYENLKIDLLGEYQQKNIITVLSIIKFLNNAEYNISEKNIYEALSKIRANTGLRGRWDIINTNPLTICDIAHNYAGIKHIINQIKNTPHKKLHMVFGVVNDKNINEIITLLPKNAQYYFTKASVPRALDENILQKEASRYNITGSTFHNVKSAITHAKNNAEKDDLIFIGGSAFIVADALHLIS